MPKKHTSSDQLIEEYVAKHFKLFVANERLILNYEESYSDNMAVWIELKNETINNENETKLEIENTILLTEFDDQLNILNYRWEQKKDSYTFNHKKQRIPIKM